MAGSIKRNLPVELPAKEREQVRTSYSTKTTKSSVIDASYDGEGERLHCYGRQILGSSATARATSFSDDSSSDEDHSPAIQQASSVRIGIPTLVRRASKAAAHSIRKGEEPVENGLSRGTASETASEAATSEVDKRKSVTTGEQGPEDALRQLEGDGSSFAKPLPSPPATKNSNLAHAAAGGLPCTHDPEYSAYLSSAAPGSRLTSISRGTPFTTPLSPLSALQSNAVSPTTTCLSRTLSKRKVGQRHFD